jgi:outer membrane protein assembly factor BamB
MLYTLGVDGDLHCWDTGRDGNKVWHINLNEQFDVPRRPKVGRSGHRDYGYTSSPLVFENWLIVEVGARQGNLIAFDKRSGKTLWRSEDKSEAGHTGGPVPMIVEGLPCVAVHNFAGLLVTRLDGTNAGKTVATYPWITSFANNIASATVHGSSVLLTSSYNHHKIARFDVNLKGAKKIWEQGEASKVCSPVVFEGKIYWAWRQLMCLDFETGKLIWKGGRYSDQGSCILTSDGRILIWSGKGQLSLAESAGRSPNEYKELAVRNVLSRDDAWPHLVLSDGQLYCKDRRGNLVCLRID